ncbi:MAG: binding 3 protein [Pseudomonadota bacterium]|nr:binding 3 protein [Pseudomonadota bacterium]
MLKLECQVLIIGGGIVGLSLAKGLEQQGISYLLVDDGVQKIHKTTRPLALSKTSIAILKYLNVWNDIRNFSTPIESIHVSVEGHFGALKLGEAGHEYLGRVIDLNELQTILMRKLSLQQQVKSGRFVHYDKNSKEVQLFCDEQELRVKAQIIIAADGALSSVRACSGLGVEAETEQQAIIGTLGFQWPHHGQAFERFTEWGPLALLPWKTHEMAMVWSMSKENALHLQQSDYPSLIKKQLAHRLGPIVDCSAIRTYPLRQIFMPVQNFQNILFLGNAAHTLHPVAGQGFNLSLRDVMTFLNILKENGIHPGVFPIYMLKRRDDQRFTKFLTRFLAGGFHRLPGFLKGIGLSALGNHSTLKQLFSYYAQGMGYPLPLSIYQILESSDE